MIEPQYDEAKPFTTWWAPAKINGKWGFVDLDGSWIIEPCYQDVSLVSGGLAGVKIGDKWVFVNSAGALVMNGAIL